MMAELDEKICKQMDGLVELLTTSGKPTLNPEIMKKFKKFCRISDGYVQHAFELLMKQLSVKHAEVRLSAYQMIDELFMRSHMFRELLLASFDTFLELSTGTEKKNPLPPPKAVAENMKNSVNRSILLWVEKFGHAYRKLTLGFEFLKNFKKIDFDSIQAALDLERRQKEETNRKLEDNRKEKLDKVNKEYSESELEIQLCVTEVENGLQLLMPRPDDFFISLKDESATSPKINAVTSTMTSSATEEVREDGNNVQSKNCLEENKINCKHKFEQNYSGDLGISDFTKHAEKGSGNAETDGAKNVSGTDESESDIKSDEDDDDEDDDFEEVGIHGNVGFTQEHGLWDRKFALTVELGQSGSRLQETEDNQDLIQGVRDQYTLIKTKYLPAVKRWLQVLNDNSGKEEKIKQMVTVKNKLEDAIKKCVELEISRSKRKKDIESDSDEDDFEDVPEKEGYEEDVPEHLKMEAVMASTSKGSKSTRGRKRSTKKAKVQTKPAQKKLLGIKNVKQMARDILESQRLLNEDDLDSAVLKSQALSSKQKSTKVSKDKDSDTFLSVDQSEGDKAIANQVHTSQAPVHQKSTSQFYASQTSLSQDSDIALETGTLPDTKAGSTPLNSVEIEEHLIDETDRKKSLLEKAPFVNYGVDLEHWENPEQIKAPVKNKFENASRFWVQDKDVDDEEPGGSEEVASLTRRSFTFAGDFEPVKWKCRAPVADGKLCERMDRVKCPFHGKIIGRDKEGVPTDPAEAEQLLKQRIKEEAEREIVEDSTSETETGASGSKGKSQGKGKGKKRAKKRKHPNLTDIRESNDNSRGRLEAKLFNRSTLRKVNKALDAASLKKLANKFSNQFNYSLK